MNFVFQKRSPVSPHEAPITVETKFYTEHIGYGGLVSITWSSLFCWYVIPCDANSVLVVTCWNDFFDRIADAGYEFMQTTFPSAWRAINNTYRKDFATECLIRTRDIDTEEAKWFLVSKVSYLDFDSAKDAAEKRIWNKQTDLLYTSSSLMEEFEGFDSKAFKGGLLNVARQLGRGLVKGTLQIVINYATQKLDLPPLAAAPPWPSVAQATEVNSFKMLC